LLCVVVFLAIGCTEVILMYVRSNDQDDESDVFPETTSSTGNPRVIAQQTEQFPMIVHVDAVDQPETFADPTSPQSMA